MFTELMFEGFFNEAKWHNGQTCQSSHVCSMFILLLVQKSNNHLQKKTVKNGINYQPQLVSLPDFWTTNSHSLIFISSSTCDYSLQMTCLSFTQSIQGFQVSTWRRYANFGPPKYHEKKGRFWFCPKMYGSVTHTNIWDIDRYSHSVFGT